MLCWDQICFPPEEYPLQLFVLCLSDCHRCPLSSLAWSLWHGTWDRGGIFLFAGTNGGGRGKTRPALEPPVGVLAVGWVAFVVVVWFGPSGLGLETGWERCV